MSDHVTTILQLAFCKEEIAALRSDLTQARQANAEQEREIAGLRSQVACLEQQLAESDEATKRAWREAGLAEG